MLKESTIGPLEPKEQTQKRPKQIDQPCARARRPGAAGTEKTKAGYWFLEA